MMPITQLCRVQGASLSEHVEPLRLLLLAEDPSWETLVRKCLLPMGSSVILLCAPNWESVSYLFENDRNALLLTTPTLQPAPGRCRLPTVLLLDAEPETSPQQVSDWLVRPSLTTDVLRRCLRHVRERGILEYTLQRLAEEDPLTGIANRQGFQTLLAVRLAENDGRGMALGHLDLDNFRHANDALGHQAGDRLILQVVARLKSRLEAGDQYGSDSTSIMRSAIHSARSGARRVSINSANSSLPSRANWSPASSLLLRRATTCRIRRSPA